MSNEEENLTQETRETLVEETHISKENVETQASKKEANEARNFEALRKARVQADADREKAEAERNDAIAKLKSYEQKPVAQEEDFNISPDDLVEGKHISKMKNQLNSEMDSLRNELKNIKKDSLNQNALLMVKAKYPDYAQIVNDDSIQILKNTYPDIAKTIASSQDPYSQAAAAYTAIKDLNLYIDPQQKAVDDRIKENLGKPKAAASMPSTGNTPLSFANDYMGRAAAKKRDFTELMKILKG